MMATAATNDRQNRDKAVQKDPDASAAPDGADRTQRPLTIELRSVHYSERFSEETACFDAVIWIDGTRAGRVRNDGRGGCHFYEPYDLQDRLEAHAKTQPPVETQMDDPQNPGQKRKFDMDADLLISGLLDDWLIRRDVKRDVARKIVFERDGKLLEIVPKPGQLALWLQESNREKLLAATRTTADLIVNLMPMENAVALYRRHAQ